MKKLLTLLFSLIICSMNYSAYAYVNNVVKSPASPSVCDAFTLTVNGDLPGTNYSIQSVSQNVSGNTITLNVFIIDNGIGIPVLVPYFVNFNYNGLDEGTYTIVANDYLNGSFSSSVTSSITITGFSNAFTSNITNTSATLNWSQLPCACEYLLKGRAAGSSSYIYLVLSGSSTTSFNASGLAPGTTYEWQVLTNCPSTGADTMRAKTPVISFTTLNCISPSPASTTNITSSSATLNWTATAGAIGYEIWGRAVGGPIVVLGINNGATTTFQVNNLSSNTTFEWAARSKCSTSPNVFSGFTAIQTFTTAVNASKAQTITNLGEPLLYPNPFSESAMLHIPESDLSFTLMITDFSGKTVKTIENLTDEKVKLNREGLTDGIYLYQLFNTRQLYNGKFILN